MDCGNIFLCVVYIQLIKIISKVYSFQRYVGKFVQFLLYSLEKCLFIAVIEGKYISYPNSKSKIA